MLHLQALDVIHSFWVPEFGQKQDAVPGQDTSLVITPTKVGTYPVICTELCGLGHALMRTSAIVMQPAEFDAWAKQQRQALKGPPGNAGKAVFSANGCSSCHTLKAAGATGKVGPDLDKLPDRRQAGGQAARRLHQGVDRGSERVRSARLPEGRDAAVRDAAADQLDALVQFLVQSSKGG